MKKTKITIRYKRSSCGFPPDQIETVKGLGLRKLHQEKTLDNTPAVRGMIKKVIHLVDVVKEG
jgi:large subunit ribosomal protein L30